MAASDSTRARRRRYARSPGERALALTAVRRALLEGTAELGVASTPQLADYAGVSLKSARRHLRELFDDGLVGVVPVPRVALANPGEAADPGLLWGSAPNVYVPTAAGARLLEDLGLREGMPVGPRYGPGRGHYLAHRIAVGDVRVWLARALRRYQGHALEDWRAGKEAELDLGGGGAPRWLRPDARFAYRLGRHVVVGLVEADRGTEKGHRRWGEKVAAYGRLFAGGRLRALTGFRNVRVIVTAPGARRRDWIARFAAEHANSELAAAIWVAEGAALAGGNLAASVWRRPGAETLAPLVSGELLAGERDDGPLEGTEGGGR